MTQNKTRLIGITGGIGTGKSTLSKILVKKGYPLIDADKIAREVVEIGRPAYGDLVEEFGEGILQENKEIHRKALGSIVFNDEEKRLKLNQIVHFHIFQEIKRLIGEISEEEALIFLDIPLLFEEYNIIKDHNIVFDEIWLVYLNREEQIRRIMKRDKLKEEEASLRINSQMDIEEKRRRAKIVIDNRSSLEDLEKQVDRLIRRPGFSEGMLFEEEKEKE